MSAPLAAHDAACLGLVLWLLLLALLIDNHRRRLARRVRRCERTVRCH